MKINYSIINFKKKGGFIELKLILSEEDWILINKFENDLTVEIILDSESLDEGKTDNNIKICNEKLSNKKLVFDFNFEEKHNEDQKVYWESQKYRLYLKNKSEELSNIIHDIKYHLTEQMKQMKDASPKNDDSCWERDIEVSY